jgi:hypothetical protein
LILATPAPNFCQHFSAFPSSPDAPTSDNEALLRRFEAVFDVIASFIFPKCEFVA